MLFEFVHPNFFHMRRLWISRAYTRSADMAKGSYPRSPYPVSWKYRGAECRKRIEEEKDRVTIEWYYWTFCCERYCYIVKESLMIDNDDGTIDAVVCMTMVMIELEITQ